MKEFRDLLWKYPSEVGGGEEPIFSGRETAPGAVPLTQDRVAPGVRTESPHCPQGHRADAPAGSQAVAAWGPELLCPAQTTDCTGLRGTDGLGFHPEASTVWGGDSKNKDSQ